MRRQEGLPDPGHSVLLGELIVMECHPRRMSATAPEGRGADGEVLPRAGLCCAAMPRISATQVLLSGDPYVALFDPLNEVQRIEFSETWRDFEQLRGLRLVPRR